VEGEEGEAQVIDDSHDNEESRTIRTWTTSPP
jgi:hypothetical protein